MQAALDEAEATRRSPAANATTTLAAAVVVLGAYQHGRATLVQAIALVVSSWLLFEVAGLAFHRLGPRHRAYQRLAALDELFQYGALVAVIGLSGSAASPLWLLVLAKTFAWLPRPAPRVRRCIAILVTTHAALAALFVARGRQGDALVTLLMLSAELLGHIVTARPHEHSLRVRAERDLLEDELRVARLDRDRERIARELHDGLGADVMALLLRLRRAADREGTPKAKQLMERAQRILGELRNVVWTLRSGQGTVGELARLIDVTCRPLCAGAAFVWVTSPGGDERPIAPGDALTALHVAQALVRAAVAADGVRQVTVALVAAEALELTVTHEAPPLDASDADDLGAIRRLLAARAGTLARSSHAAGAEWRATLPLGPQAPRRRASA